jgi:hypothetical protein
MAQFGYRTIGCFPRLKARLLGFAALAWLMTGSPAWAQLQPVTLTPLDANSTTGYATYGGHNQKVVVNQYGIFVSYLHKGNGDMNQTQWRLQRSVDGGATFTTVDQSPDVGLPQTEATYPPVLETDSAGNIYMIRASAGTNEGPAANAYLRVYSASTNFAPPSTQFTIQYGAAQKFAMVLDEARGRIYYAAHTFHGGSAHVDPDGSNSTLWFFIIGLDGTPIHNYRLTRRCLPDAPTNPPTPPKPCESYNSSYPQLALDDQGDLYVAWANVRGTSSGDYSHYSTHVMRSHNGGSDWETLSGAAVTLPAIADNSSTVTMINDDTPVELTGSKLLWGMRVKQGKLHFAYRNSDTNEQHYVRFDTGTGLKDLNVTSLGGTTIKLNSLDGFCTAANKPDDTVYCVGRREENPGEAGDSIAVVASYDNGQTWQDYASTGEFGIFPFGITGPREIRDGHIVGMFTLGGSGGRNIVHFFRIPVKHRVQPAGVTVSAAVTGYPATYAIDGSESTQWVASLANNPSANFASITLDLGAIHQIRNVKWKGALFTPYPSHSPADYTIAVSDNLSTWTTVVTRTNSGGIVNGDEPVQVNARYVKLATTKVNDGSGWGLSLHEFWVEGMALPATRLPASIEGIDTVEHPIANLNDGRYDTQWVASLTPHPANNNVSVYMYFGATFRQIARLKWVAATGNPYPANAPKNYIIESSNDGFNWSTVLSRSAPDFRGITVGSEAINVTTRFLRLTTSQVYDGSGWSLSFLEFWAEGW